MKIQIAEQFEYLLYKEKRKRYNIFYGGRGGGKTHNVMLFCMLEFLQHAKNILILREFQVNNKDSVYAEFLSFIYEQELHFLEIREERAKKLLDCNKSEIINNLTNNRITFYGLNDNNIMNLKSYSGYDIAWVEEAHYISKRALDVLDPTLRKKESFLLFTFNPQDENDYIYQLAKSENEHIQASFINYTDNPFYTESNLEQSRLLMLKNVELGIDTIDNYNHVWLGMPQPLSADCIFSNDVFTKCLLYEYDTSLRSYIQMCIAIDPATTSKDYSNETGIIVAGITKDRIVHVIADFSGVMTPKELSKIVNEIYTTLRIDCIVVETNNGGDFIKASLLHENPLLPIKEVRAVRDKKDRASPVAILMGLQKVFIYEEASKKLFAQMKKLTTRGYMGLKGESPDRLDSMVWAVYHLLDLKDFDTRNTLFYTGLYTCDTKGYVYRKECAMGVIASDIFVVLQFDIILDNERKKIYFTHCFIQETHTLKEFLESYTNLIYFRECELIHDLGLLSYAKSELEFQEYIMQTIPKIQNNINVSHVKAGKYQNYYGNLLVKNLDECTQETKNNIIVSCFCDVLHHNL